VPRSPLEDVQSYLAVMDRLRAQSAIPEQTARFLKELVAEQM
jgi:uncharacterized protein YutE (UPF0331/DUF86 family)